MSGEFEQVDSPRMALSAEQVARKNASFDWLTAAAGAVYWIKFDPATQQSELWAATDLDAKPRAVPNLGSSIESGLHAYGGRPYAVGSPGAWAVDAGDGRVRDDAGHRLGDPAYECGDLSSGDGWLLGVRETDAGDELVGLPTGEAEFRVLRASPGFFSSPVVRDGRLAWAEWDRSVMPWDSSEIWAGTLHLGGVLDGPERVAGGPEESAVQPQWGPDGCLYFMSDRTGWWNLYRWDGMDVVAVAPMEAECAAAPWESGYSTYTFLPGGRIGILAQSGPRHRLVVAEPGGEITAVESPFTSFKPFLAAAGERLAVIASSAESAQQVALLATGGTAGTQILSGTSPAPVRDLDVSVPQVVRIDSDGSEITVLYYPPTQAPDVMDIVPAPLIVKPHAGPTYNNELRLDWEIQFFTSRGFAVAEVDYRGSTGYGRSFRKALDGHWGVLDVEDCRRAAEHFITAGLANPAAVFISGASAGGYTALKAVCEDSPFALAVARSAIVNPEGWVHTAPRFQRPHAAILAHPGAAVVPGQVRRPALLIHGRQDDVAPVWEVEEFAKGLRSRDLLIDLLAIEGTGHSLSKPGAVVRALTAELDAYRSLLGTLAPR